MCGFRLIPVSILQQLPLSGRRYSLESEMLLKAARMQTPIIASRSSPTEYAISLSRELGITVIGYTLGNSLSVFSGEERLLPDEH
jgi:FdhD protein